MEREIEKRVICGVAENGLELTWCGIWFEKCLSITFLAIFIFKAKTNNFGIFHVQIRKPGKSRKIFDCLSKASLQENCSSLNLAMKIF